MWFKEEIADADGDKKDKYSLAEVSEIIQK
jgi:hypothetical protein